MGVQGSDPNISDAVHDGWNDNRGGQVRLAALQHQLRHGSPSDAGPLATSMRSPEPEPSPMRSKRFGATESVVSVGSREGSQWGGIAQEAPKTWHLLNQRSQQGFPAPQSAPQELGNAIDVAIDVRNRWIEESAYMLGMLAKLQLQMEAEGVESPPLWRGMAEATPKTWQYLQVAVEDPSAFQRMMTGQQIGPEGASALGAQERAGLESVKLRAQRLKQGLVGPSVGESQNKIQNAAKSPQEQMQQEWENNARANEARREELRQELLKAQHELRDELSKKSQPESMLSDGIRAVSQLRDRWMKESAHLSMQLSELHSELAMEGRPVPSNQLPDSFRPTTAGNTARTMLSSTLPDTTRTGMDMPLTPASSQRKSIQGAGQPRSPPTGGTSRTWLEGLDGGAPTGSMLMPPAAGHSMGMSAAPAGMGEGLSNYSFGSLPPGQPPPMGTSFGTTPGSVMSGGPGMMLPYQAAPAGTQSHLTSPGGLVSHSSSRGGLMADEVPTCPNPDLVRQRGAERRGSQGGSSNRSNLSSEEKRHRRQSIQKAISGLDALQAQISAVRRSPDQNGRSPDQNAANSYANNLNSDMIPADILPSNSSASASCYSLRDQVSKAGNSATSIGSQGMTPGSFQNQYEQQGASGTSMLGVTEPQGASNASMLRPQLDFNSSAAFAQNGHSLHPQYGRYEAVGEILAQALCTPRESDVSQPPSFPVTPAQPPRQLRNSPPDHSISHFGNPIFR